MKRKNSRAFAPLRRVVEHMYTYGFFAREDYVRAGLVSARTYDDILRQLRDLYLLDDTDPAQAAITVTVDGKFRRYRFRRDYFAGQSRMLEAVFGLHSVSESAAALTIACLALGSRPDGVSVTEAARTVELNGASEDGQDCTSTVSRRLSSLAKAGYVRREGRRYVRACPLDGLSDEDLTRLWYLASFAAGGGYPRVAAAFLRDAIRRHLLLRGVPQPAEAFLFRDSPCGNMLDEQLVLRLRRCCSRFRKAVVREGGRESVALPVALRIDRRYGRWYLLAVRDGVPAVLRISRIDEVTELEESFSPDEARKQVEEAFRYNYISSHRTARPVRVEAELFFGEDEKDIRQQFLREIVFGGIEQRQGRTYYCAEVNDPRELLPLLRAYGPWLRILPGEGHSLDRELREEYERMLQRYGPVQ